MKLGIVADTHNNLVSTQRALEILRERGIERIIHCGDITTPAVVELFNGFQTTFVFGNIDHSHADLMEAAKRLMGTGAMGYHYTASIDGIKVAVCHGDDPQMLDDFVKSGNFRYVFHGHTHLRRDELVGKTRVINPGALGGQQKQSRSVCILDLDSEETEFIEVDGVG